MFDKLNKNVLQGRVNPLNREMYSKKSPGWRWDGFHQGAGSCPAFTRFFNLRSQLEEYKYDINHNDIIHQEAIRHKKSWMI